MNDDLSAGITADRHSALISTVMHASTGAVAVTCCVRQIGIKGSKKVG
jgi:hypothetical protein